MKRQSLACLLLAWAWAGVVRSAPLTTQTAAPLVERGDVIVNVGAVTTVKTVVKRPKPTTVYVPITVHGEETSSAVTSTFEEEVTTVITQTAVETQVVMETVQEGKTIPVTMTTTAFQLELQTETQMIQVVETEYQQSTVVQTLMGVPVTSVVTVMMTDENNNEQPKPTNTKTMEVAPDNDHDEEGTPKTTDKEAVISVPSSASSSIPASSTALTAAQTTGGTLNLNNTADASADSNADVDSTNTNSNNVTVSIDSAGEWAADNNLIGISVAILVVAIAIAIFACSSNKSSGNSPSPSAQQSFVFAQPSGGGSTAPTQQASVAPRPVQSLGRPSRRGGAQGRYRTIDEGDSSALSDSSGEEYDAPMARKGSFRSTASGSGSRAEQARGR